jgi:large subunit ribosomal protein L21
VLVFVLVSLTLGLLLVELLRWRQKAKEYEAQLQLLMAELEEQAFQAAIQAPLVPMAVPTVAPEKQEPQAAFQPDDLTVIKGIGPAYQKQLQAGGIGTLAQLAAATPEHIRAILNAPQWRKIDPAAWIEQAKTLVANR